ncbi:MAG: DNA polymerase III subunit delta' [Thermodesulfobacteriota bacterium]
MQAPDLTQCYPGLLQSQSRIVNYLHSLEQNRPNVLFLEGGSLQDRRGLALYWAALLNCTYKQPPCLECFCCRQIANQAFRDLFLFQGLQENIKIDQVREARAIMGQKPDAGQMRVFVLEQAQELTQAAANSLLKCMEEPLSGNCFVLLAPQRQLLLPTLVSRSLVLTLSRSVQEVDVSQEAEQWLGRLLEFWRTGRGLLSHSSAQGAVDKRLVQEVLVLCQQSLLQAGRQKPGGELSRHWRNTLDAQGWSRVCELLQQAQQALDLQVHPALVLEWVGVKVRTWL